MVVMASLPEPVVWEVSMKKSYASNIHYKTKKGKKIFFSFSISYNHTKYLWSEKFELMKHEEDLGTALLLPVRWVLYMELIWMKYHSSSLIANHSQRKKGGKLLIFSLRIHIKQVLTHSCILEYDLHQARRLIELELKKQIVSPWSGHWNKSHSS